MHSYLTLSAHDLAKGIRHQKFSSVEVMRAHLDRIREINPSINAVIQIDEEKALKQAADADRLALLGKFKGPLHGVPFTVKDVMETAEFYSTSGLPERREFRADRDATVVARLKAAGGILLGKTNLPQGGEGIGSSNPLFGRTNNPHDLSRTPGGSSSGEAAIIAAGGSPLGIGSDSGGSLRIPAHFCGVATLKPTTGRIPSTGHFPKIGDAMDSRSQIGPLARTVGDLFLAFKIIQGSDGIDPYVIDMPVLSPADVDTKKLRIAYYYKSGNITPDADTYHVLEGVASSLSREGYNLKEHEPPHLNEVMEITLGYWNHFEKETSSKEYFHLLAKWDAFRSHMLQFMQNYDAILLPVATKAAPLHGDLRAADVVYTLTYSLVGWPCVVIRGGSSQGGLPIGIQVVAKPFKEDVALALAEKIAIFYSAD